MREKQVAIANGQVSNHAPPKTKRERVRTESQCEIQLRSYSSGVSGLTDQYADGKAAQVWQLYIGDCSSRTTNYKEFVTSQLKSHRCKEILDAACGTGVDSVMLLEEDYNLVSCDASDKMLKTAYKTRWDRRKEEQFDKWEIEEANWLTLPSDISAPSGSTGFDAIICMGNSFAHLPDFHGDQRDHKLAIANFYELLKPGGILIIDHRNYDYILDHGKSPKNNIYYNSEHIVDIKTSVLYVNNEPSLITLDYEMDASSIFTKPEDKIK
jgi:glycine N-methyltransferase